MAKVNLENIKDIKELNAKHNEWLKSNQAQEREFNECRQRLIREEREARRRDEELFRGKLADSVAKENGFPFGVAIPNLLPILFTLYERTELFLANRVIV